MTIEYQQSNSTAMKDYCSLLRFGGMGEYVYLYQVNYRNI